MGNWHPRKKTLFSLDSSCALLNFFCRNMEKKFSGKYKGEILVMYKYKEYRSKKTDADTHLIMLPKILLFIMHDWVCLQVKCNPCNFHKCQILRISNILKQTSTLENIRVYLKLKKLNQILKSI